MDNLRCVYLATFSDNYAYVGTAEVYEDRVAKHLFDDKRSEVYQHKRHTGLVPEFTMIHNYTDAHTADELEYKYTIEYACKGYKMLNLQRPGGFKGLKSKTRKKVEFDYVDFPIALLQVNGDMSLMQEKVLYSAVIYGRDSVNRQTQNQTYENVTIQLCFHELGVDTNQYADVEKACKQFLEERYSYGTSNTPISMFNQVSFPLCNENDESKRRGLIYIGITNKIWSDLFDIRNKKAKIASCLIYSCRSPRTARLYAIAKSHKNKEIRIKYEQLLTYLGIKNRTTFPIFQRDVLTPASTELERLCNEEKSDLYLKYEAIYSSDKTRGEDPVEILFKVIYPYNVNVNKKNEPKKDREDTKVEAMVQEKPEEIGYDHMLCTFNSLIGEFSITDIRLMLTLMRTYSIRKELYMNGKVNTIFEKKSDSEELSCISIPRISFGIPPKDYPDIKQSCINLINTLIYSIDINGNTCNKKVFQSIDYPNRNEDKVLFWFTDDVKQILFADDVMEIKYPSNISKLTTRARTIRLYIRLCEYKRYESVEIPYDQIVRFLWAENKYGSYSHFIGHVLESISKEIELLHSEGKVDFHFSYEKIDYTPKRRGSNPDAIKFSIK